MTDKDAFKLYFDGYTELADTVKRDTDSCKEVELMRIELEERGIYLE